MSVHPTTTTVTRGIAVAGTILTGLAFCATASATSTAPTPKVVEGNPTCAAAGAGYTDVKIDPVPQGGTTFSGGGLSGAIEVDGVEFDWVTSKAITAIVVKGGPSANVYRFAATKSGYGFMFWVTAEGHEAGIPRPSYTMSGAGGQRVTVFPHLNTVVVHRMDTDEGRGPWVNSPEWDHLLRELMKARVH